MVNKRVIIVAAVLLVSVVVSHFYFRYLEEDRERGLLKYAIITANSVVSAFSGNIEIGELDRDLVDAGLDDKILAFELLLKGKKDAYIDLDAMYAEMFDEPDESITSPPIVGEPLDGGGYVSGDIGLGDSSHLIEVIDGVNKISVNNLEFNEEGIAFLLFRGVFLEFHIDNVPETYELMLKNTKYVLDYDSHVVGDSYIDVLFKSLFREDFRVLVRVFIENDKLVDFEVRR